MTTKTESTNPEHWLQEHGDIMFAFAMNRIGNKTVAEDLVQEALLGAIKNVDKFSSSATVRTWLLSILKNKIVDYIRSKYTKTASTNECLDEMFDSEGSWKIPPTAWKTDPTMHLHEEEFKKVLQACLDDLPENQRTLVMLHAFRDASTKELCNLLGITATNVGVVLHRSRHRLRKCLEDHWFMPENTS
ncbi:sigma-70 family RNA polymerase sigma factor [PVC group bacterium]|nr:sigma-70 family RNA polymerase sigma factor [PVC group bacterium]